MRFPKTFPTKIVVLFLMFNASLFAQWSTDATVNNAINTSTGSQTYPKIISDGSGGAIITWEDLRNGNSDIYAQRIKADGTIGWTSSGVVISTATGSQTVPQIISDGSGGAFITWQDGGGSNYKIYVQHIDADGSIHTGWTTNGVAISTSTSNQQGPQLISDGSGGTIITWENWGTWQGTYYQVDIYAQRIDANGTIYSGWAAGGAAVCTWFGEKTSPQVTSDGSGGAIITWQDKRGGTYYDIYAQKINSSGAKQWTANGVAICTEANNQTYPKIISDGSSGAIITWSDNRGTDYDIYAQRIDADGTIHAGWAANGVSICTSANDQRFSQLISDGSSGAIITWEDIRDGSSYDIYTQKINSSGVGQWGANGTPICVNASFQDVAQITSDGSNGAIITWEDYRNGKYDVYAQRISSSGTISWTTNGVAVFIHTAQNADKPYPQIISDGSGGAIIAWMEIYNVANSYDIYASKIGSNGVLPVELTSFIASSKQNSVELSWRTATEINNYGFEIEKSRIQNTEVSNQNKAEAWKKIGFVEGNGTTNVPKEYMYNDKNIGTGNYFYRLKQIDRDGKFEYSQQVEITVSSAPKEFALEQNYPNPFNPTTTIEFTVPSNGRATLKIFNTLGEEVATLFNGEADARKYNQVQFNASNLASGIYFAKLQSGDKIQLKKMLLIK